MDRGRGRGRGNVNGRKDRTNRLDLRMVGRGVVALHVDQGQNIRLDLLGTSALHLDLSSPWGVPLSDLTGAGDAVLRVTEAKNLVLDMSGEADMTFEFDAQDNQGAGTADLTGTADEGETLTCTFNDDDPNGAATGVTYQWFRGVSTSIGGATASTYVLTGADVGSTVKCRVRYTDAHGFNEEIFTDDSDTVEATDSGNATASLTGTATEGQTLTCTFNDNDPDGAATGVTYQWIRGASTEIGGATSNTYALTNADAGSTVKCRVRYTDGQGFSEEIFTSASATVAAVDSGDATASLSGTPTEGQTLFPRALTCG